MNFERYNEYKDTEIEWLGKIPKEWKIGRVKDLIINNIYGTSKNTSSSGRFEVLTMGGIQGGKVIFSNKKFINQVSKELLLKKGDILYTRTNGSLKLIGKAGIIEKEVINTSFASYLVRLRFKKRKNPKYYNYLFNAKSFRDMAKSISISTAQNNLSSAKYIQIVLPIIDLKEANIIANYLDIKTQKIDSEISILEQKKEKYKELKQTLISETVLRGLDKNIELKESGVGWIGDIPKHWEIKRLKDFIKFTISGEVIDTSYWNEGNELTYTAGKNPVYSSFDSFPNRKRTKKEDILVSRNGDGFVHIPKLNSIFTNVVQLIRLSKTIHIKFIFYVLENIKFHINRTSNGDFIASLNKDMWFNSFIPEPPLDEQIKIANYLDEKTSKMDLIVQTIDSRIKILKEFRKTLINDVVTGKVKVA